jgi:gamma-glutamyltranspeptidase/glutathione hydrolase
LQTLNLLDVAELYKLGHNSTGYLHRLTEAVKLAFADRETYFGDPRIIDVPIEPLLSREYAQQRRRMIRPDRAWPEMPPAGDPRKLVAEHAPSGATSVPVRDLVVPEPDTSHVCVIDQHGNAFAATPSDGSYNAPVVPGLGIIPSPRGSQSWGDPDHPSGVAPGKRPRLTPSPAIAIQPGKLKMPFGTPGGDVQTHKAGAQSPRQNTSRADMRPGWPDASSPARASSICGTSRR